MNITAKKALKYALLPQIFPRLREFLASGFGYVSFFIAQVYGAVRLLPPHHPYLSPANMGKFGIHHVVAQAALNLRFRRENADQIIIFVLIMAGLAVLMMQFGMLGLALFMGTARAAAMPTNFSGFFISPNATNDVAYVLLDRVFGVPGLFTDSGGGATCVANNFPCFQFATMGQADVGNPFATSDGAWPWPFHEALHGLFQFYSMGLLVIAGLIFVYYVAAVAVETAESGTPFGRRFNHVWAPIRMVAAIGLLIPVTNGLNTAQYIVLYAAKYGSGFATNGWNIFLAELAAQPAPVGGTNTVAGDSTRLVVTPQPPDPISLLEYATVLNTCWWAEGNNGGSGPPVAGIGQPEDLTRRVCGWMVNPAAAPPQQVLTPTTTYEDALNFYQNGDVQVVFGEYRLGDITAGALAPPPPIRSTPPNKYDFAGGLCTAGYSAGRPVYTEYRGAIKPICGEVVLPTTATIVGGVQSDPGAYYAQQQYFQLLKQLWFGTVGSGSGNACLGTVGTIQPDAWGIALAQRYGLEVVDLAVRKAGADPNSFGDPNAPVPTMAQIDCLINEIRWYISDTINVAVNNEITTGNWAIGNVQDLGWGGAGVWYNKIAQINGALITATQALPYVRKFPEVMERVRDEKLKNDRTVIGRDRFKPFMSDGQAVTFERASDAKVATALWEAYDTWKEAYPKGSDSPEILKSIIHAIFGLEGLYSILDNPTTYPLAQLVGIGKSLVESSIRNLGYYAVATGGSMLGASIGIGSIAGLASSFFFQIAMLGLGIGFVLFYVIPFLPFIYFFFAVGGWVKGIFEAMVGVPLWALAHIRIDGQGLPGDVAMGGYYLILEVFLRPIMIVMGMLGSIIIFSGQVFLLHETWNLVVSNIGGFDYSAAGSAASATATGALGYARGVVDSFFYTVAYAIMVYMMAMSSFKLVDQVPNHILRWMGASVSTFGEQNQDAAENLVRNVAVGESFATQAIQGAEQGIKGTAQGLAAALKGKQA